MGRPQRVAQLFKDLLTFGPSLVGLFLVEVPKVVDLFFAGALGK